MPLWKRNLLVCWFGMFVTGIGMSQIAPILPLYVQYLGVDKASEVARLSGLAFGITFIVSAIFSPIWGAVSDRVGRKPMLLRASLGMSVVIFFTGFAPSVPILIFLRILLGTITGYSTACTTLIATQTDIEYAGYALGTLSTANVAGALLGPMIGGFVEDTISIRAVFFITGGLTFIAFLTTLLFVKENFNPYKVKKLSSVEVWEKIPEKKLTIILSVTFFMINFALFSIQPIITVYVTQLIKGMSHVALLSGLVFSVSGLANVLTAPYLGRLSDRIGGHKVILVSLILAGFIYLPQAFVTKLWQFIALQFLLGLTMGGLTPSVNTLIKKITPQSMTGRVFGFTIAAGYLGTFAGAVMGGQIAAILGIRSVFFMTSGLLLLNALLVYFKVYKRLDSRRHSPLGISGQNP